MKVSISKSTVIDSRIPDNIPNLALRHVILVSKFVEDMLSDIKGPLLNEENTYDIIFRNVADAPPWNDDRRKKFYEDYMRSATQPETMLHEDRVIILLQVLFGHFAFNQFDETHPNWDKELSNHILLRNRICNQSNISISPSDLVLMERAEQFFEDLMDNAAHSINFM